MIPRTAISISNEELSSILLPVMRNGNEEIVDFEMDLVSYLGALKVFAVNSGRTALYLALQALGLKKGENVIVPAYTCAIVFEVILRLGLKPNLVDVDPETYNIDPELIPEAITSETRAIIPVHLFGAPCRMDQIMEIASMDGLFVVEDVAQALGAEYKGRKLGTFGDLAIFSFGPGKNITGGEGGALVVNNEELREKITELRNNLPNPGLSWELHVVKNIIAMKACSNPHFYALMRNFLEEKLKKSDRKILNNCMTLLNKGTNINPAIELAKMPSISAGVANRQLKRIDEINQKRINNARILNRLFDDMNYKFVSLPENHEKLKHVFSRYPVKLPKSVREYVAKEMLRQGIDTEKPYSYLKPFLQRYSMICAIDLCDTLLTIPNHPLLKEKDLQHLSKAFEFSIRKCTLSS